MSVYTRVTFFSTENTLLLALPDGNPFRYVSKDNIFPNTGYFSIDFFRCLKLEIEREKVIEIFKLLQVSVISLFVFGLSLVSRRQSWRSRNFYNEEK